MISVTIKVLFNSTQVSPMAFFHLVKKTFSLDERSLAFYRFFIGLIIAVDSCYRMLDLTNFYTDIGLIPRALFLSEMAMPWSFSVFLANGSFEFALALFILNVFVGLSIMLGFKTRWMMILAYIMNVSIHNRNWLINNGGDDILRAILFLSMFLPLDKYFSIDSALRRDKDRSSTDYFSVWSLTFYLQVFLIYFIGWVLKDHAIWREDFTAVFYSSRLDIFSTPIGLWLRQFPTMQKGVTIWSILLEWGGPLLIAFSFLFGRFWWRVRMFVVFSFIAFHIGIILTMWIGVFPYTCIVMWTIFLPGPFWDRVGVYFRKKDFHKLVLYFDSNCRFCEKSAMLMREFFLLPDVRVEKAQSDKNVQTLMESEVSWVIVDSSGEKHTRYHGFIAILRHSAWGRYLAPILSARFFSVPGNGVYRWVSHHRPLMSKFSQYLSFTEEKKPFLLWTLLINGLGVFFFLTILNWNLATIKKLNHKAPFFQSVARAFHLYQEWNMFAPYPKLDNIWVEAPAVLMDGSEIDLITGERDVYSIKDQSFVKAIKNEHWRKFYLNVSEKVDNSRYYGGYFCRLWNERKEGLIPGVKLRKLELIVFSQINLPNGDRGGITRKSSWKHWCFDSDYKKESKQAEASN